MFPFIFNGKTYNACTNDDHSRYWCYYNKANSWGDCTTSKSSLTVFRELIHFVHGVPKQETGFENDKKLTFFAK